MTKTKIQLPFFPSTYSVCMCVPIIEAYADEFNSVAVLVDKVEIEILYSGICVPEGASTRLDETNFAVDKATSEEKLCCVHTTEITTRAYLSLALKTHINI